MLPSNFLRGSLMLSSTAKAATTQQSYTVAAAAAASAVVSRRTISTSRPSLFVNKSQQQFPIPSLPRLAKQDTQKLASLKNKNNNNKKNSKSETILEDTESVQAATNYTYPSDIKPPSVRQYPYTLKTGTVTSVGLMDKTVRVAYKHREWDRHIRKSYPKTTTYLVSDPRNSLREGDVVEFSSGAPKSRHVRHVVERIIAPFGERIEDRPAVLSREERETEKVQKRMEKLARKAGRVAEQVTQSETGEVEQVTRRFLESKDHIGRIKSLVLERTATIAA